MCKTWKHTKKPYIKWFWKKKKKNRFLPYREFSESAIGCKGENIHFQLSLSVWSWIWNKHINSHLQTFIVDFMKYWQFFFLSTSLEHWDDLLSELLSLGIRVFLQAIFSRFLDPCYRFETNGHSDVRFMVLYLCLTNSLFPSCDDFTRLSAATKSSLQRVFQWDLQKSDDLVMVRDVQTF